MSGLDGLIKIGAAGLLVYGVYYGVNADDVVSMLGDATHQAQEFATEVEFEGDIDYGKLPEPDEPITEFWSAESGREDEAEASGGILARIGDDAQVSDLVEAPSAILNEASEGTAEADPCTCQDENADGTPAEECDDEEVADEDRRDEEDGDHDCDDQDDG